MEAWTVVYVTHFSCMRPAGTRTDLTNKKNYRAKSAQQRNDGHITKCLPNRMLLKHEYRLKLLYTFRNSVVRFLKVNTL